MMNPIPGARSDNGQPNIFGDMKQFTARAAGHPGAAIDQMLKSPSSDMAQVDPDSMVQATVRPNNNWGGMPAGSVVPVTRREFDANRACLATADEYTRILAVEASPHTQADHRALHERGLAQRDATRGAMTPEERTRLAELQAQARADQERNQALQDEILAAARARQVAPPPVVVPASRKDLDARIERMRAEHEAQTAHKPARIRERLDAILAEEIADLETAFAQQAAKMTEAAKAPMPLVPLSAQPKSPAAALKELNDLHLAGLLTDEEFGLARQAQAKRLMAGEI